MGGEETPWLPHPAVTMEMDLQCAFCIFHVNESRVFYPLHLGTSWTVQYNTPSLFCRVPAVCPWQLGGRRGSQQLLLACTGKRWAGNFLCQAMHWRLGMEPLELSRQGTSAWDTCQLNRKVAATLERLTVLSPPELSDELLAVCIVRAPEGQWLGEGPSGSWAKTVFFLVGITAGKEKYRPALPGLAQELQVTPPFPHCFLQGTAECVSPPAWNRDKRTLVLDLCHLVRKLQAVCLTSCPWWIINVPWSRTAFCMAEEANLLHRACVCPDFCPRFLCSKYQWPKPVQDHPGASSRVAVVQSGSIPLPSGWGCACPWSLCLGCSREWILHVDQPFVWKFISWRIHQIACQY